MDLKQMNVLLLGLAFFFLFFSFQTSVFIQQTVVNSIRSKPDYNFNGDGYVSLCITYAVFALSNWLAPSVITLTGAKYGMLLGAATYVLYSASFIYPATSLFYLAAGLLGLGAGLLWTAQGSFLSENSTPETSTRNAAIFWSMLQSSILFGNLFVYFAFDSQAEISDRTRYIVYGVLTIVGALGALVFLLLRSQTACDGGARARREPDGARPEGPKKGAQPLESRVTAWGQFVEALRLARTWDMILLSSAFLFTGQLLSFFTGVYGTAIGATSQFGPDSKKYIGLAGIFIGVGEIVGGSIFGLLGARVNKLMGRDTIFVMGYLVTLAALALTLVNLPPDSPLASRSILPALMREPKIWLAMLGSVLIGLGDACFNTQIYTLLISVYRSNPVGAFALFKFVQSAGSAGAFLYSTRLNLYYQLSILAVISTIATICFCVVEWHSSRASARALAATLAGGIVPRRKIEKTESQQNIIANEQQANGSSISPSWDDANSRGRSSSESSLSSTAPPSSSQLSTSQNIIRNMTGATGGNRKLT